jgi:Holliday junction resolvase-like predicted endonuclease
MNITNFQAESKHSGDAFEEIVLEDITRSGQKNIARRVVLKDLGIEVDFVYETTNGKVYVEAKGGEAGSKKRPGAKRTDNVKKAIANGALIKAFYPEIKYIVYFSDLPKHGSSSHKMIKKAIMAGYVDAFKYLIKM